MSDIDKRVEELSPKKQEIWERLLARAGAPPAPAPVSAAEEAPRSGGHLALDVSSPSEPNALKASYKRFYDGVSAQLTGNVFGQYSFFLNYGYVSDGQEEFAAVALPERYINKNSVKLVMEVVGDVPIEGRRVLDVGCGRGGTVHVLTTFYKPATVTGVDLSTNAIAFSRQTHKGPHIAFHEGDAENLPFADGSFDVVTNIESSHSYPHIHHFYSQVHRVLAPGGYFLYTDALSTQQFMSSRAYLEHIGFTLERDRDITRNVLLSCDEVATNRLQAFDSRNDQNLMQNFLATPGSQVYQELRSGNWSYRIYKLRKSA